MVVLRVMLLVLMELVVLVHLVLVVVLGAARSMGYGDAVVVLVVEPLVVREGPVAGQGVGALQPGGLGAAGGVVEVVLDLLGDGPVVPLRGLFGLTALVAAVLLGHFFLALVRGTTFVDLVVTNHAGSSRRGIVKVTATGRFGSHLGCRKYARNCLHLHWSSRKKRHNNVGGSQVL